MDSLSVGILLLQEFQYITYHTLQNYIFYQLNNIGGWKLENGVIIVAFEFLVVLVLSLVFKILWKGITSW